MDFEELLNQLANPGDEGPSDTIFDDLRTAHTTLIDGSNTKIQELTDTIGARDEEIGRLKAANWDLFEQIPKAGDDNPADEPNEGEEQPADAPESLDDLIVEEEQD